MPRERTTDELVDGVLRGNRLLLARAITQVENESENARAILSAVYGQTGGAHIVGITGAPGTGKSTLVTALVQSYRAAALSVAVVAVDPTSPYSGGALLGDRVRMRALSGDAGVFVRSMATRGSLGGLSATTSGVITLLDAAGFDRILVETVGVGQAEVEIASAAHTTVVVEAPGLGDEVQAIKAGVLEIADILVVNKADRSGADRTVRALELALHADGGAARAPRHHGRLLAPEPSSDAAPADGWEVRVLKSVAAEGAGVDDLRQRIEEHHDWLRESGEIAQRNAHRTARMLENLIHAELNRRLRKRIAATRLAEWVEAVQRRETDPYRAATVILQELV
jgi:LAO/AO transport system kinase